MKMKKWLFIVILVILLIIVGFFYFKKSITRVTSPNVLSETEGPTFAPTAWKQSIVISVNRVPIRISWTIVNPKEVNLFSNLKEQKLSEEIKVNKSCKILVNGGFYSKENTHLGLFTTDFETISKPIQSATLNGFLWIKSDNVSIQDNVPDNNPRIVIQSGPLIMLNNETLPLKINNDEPNRRIVAGTTPNNKLIFLAVYRDGSIYQGPLLGQLPEIINLFQKQTGIKIVNAINLDGGSASIFISDYDRLNELSHVGSYFCIK